MSAEPGLPERGLPEPEKPRRRAKGAGPVREELADLRAQVTSLSLASAAEKEPLPSTEKARKVARDLRKKLADTLDTMALTRAERRRASTMDVTDYEAAFDDLANPQPRPRWLDLPADLATLFSGIFLGYSINIITGEKPSIALAGATFLAGLLFGVGAIVIKSHDLR